MQQLSKAIIAKYAATAALMAALPNGLWDTEAPPQTSFPYGVFQLITDTSDLTFTDSKENCVVQFKIYSDTSGSSVALDAILKELLAAYNFCELIIDDYTFLSMRKINIIKNKIEGIWEYLILFRIVLVEAET